MTEAVWLISGDPGAMLKVARPTASDRKMRLFAAACWYRVWASQMDARTRAAVELFVGHVDGTVSPGDWFEGFTAAGGVNLGKHFRLLICPDALLAATESAKFAALDVAWQEAWDAVDVDAHAAFEQRGVASNRRSDFRKRALGTEEAAQAALVREVFGNPFRPAAFDPAWRTDTAVALAKGMYAARDFSAMPILADALQDAGCDSDDVLTHCRAAGEHVRGCWVVDSVLRRS